MDSDKVHTLSLVYVSLKPVFILKLSYPNSSFLLFLVIFLLKKLNHFCWNSCKVWILLFCISGMSFSVSQLCILQKLVIRSYGLPDSGLTGQGCWVGWGKTTSQVEVCTLIRRYIINKSIFSRCYQSLITWMLRSKDSLEFVIFEFYHSSFLF